MQSKKLHIVETRTYLSRVSQLAHKGQDIELLRHSIKELLAKNPLQGKIIPRAGGVRKLRFPMPGKGKRGGYRVIYYFYDEVHPIFLISIYAKNVAENLTAKEEKEFNELVMQWKSVFRGE